VAKSFVAIKVDCGDRISLDFDGVERTSTRHLSPSNSFRVFVRRLIRIHCVTLVRRVSPGAGDFALA
jgi:hypothetical protein